VNSTERLLLLLARGTLESEVWHRARDLVGQDVGWPRLCQLSEAHGVAPLVARNLARLGAAGVPDETRAVLEAARRVNAARNLLAARILGRVLASLEQAEVPVIPLKGVALSESLYGDATLRVSSDVDILVRRRDMARAFAVLVGLGYDGVDMEPEVGARNFDLLLASNIEYAFAPPESPRCPVELHWDIAWRWPRDASAIADLWGEARPRLFRGVEARALSPEWEILYLAVHAARHRWQALKWLVDVHEICVRGEVNWAEVWGKARRFGLVDVLRITLAACLALLETPIPAHIAVGGLPRWLSLFPSAPGSLGIWREAVYPARLFARPSEKLSYLARVLLLPTLAERRLVRLPAALRMLYYPLRPLRLGGKWGLDLVRAGLREIQ